jgi:hydroxymethylpyrimidine/phosphomethylpyrimidine kinase
VLDPVLGAKDGTSLLDGEGLSRLKSDLLPLARVVTPNLSEASAISGREVKDRDGMKEAARRIHSLGPEWVVVKGGHLEECATDVLYNGVEFFEIESPRLNTKSQGVHGTGCTFSSAIAAELAKGKEVPTAVEEAKRFVTHAIENALVIGLGYPVVNQFG